MRYFNLHTAGTLTTMAVGRVKGDAVYAPVTTTSAFGAYLRHSRADARRIKDRLART